MSSKSGRLAREAREKSLLLKHKFENRITNVRFGKESFDISDYATAIKKYTDYLNTLGEVKQVKDHYGLRVAHFDPKKDLTEMMMISHLYFELARMYDAVPKFQAESQKCLDQFVHFTANQPYQVVNSEMIRKYLKKAHFKNHETFHSAYQSIYVQSKKCYVVTFCYGEEHPVTENFRALKDQLLETHFGRELVRVYYKHSSVMVERYADNDVARIFSGLVMKPLLLVFSKTLLPLILRR